ncbi:hypothetical protein V1264_024385 [Littorina saxatilis]
MTVLISGHRETSGRQCGLLQGLESVQGLENLHKITVTQSFMTAVKLTDWNGNFSVGPESLSDQPHVLFVVGDASN